MSAKRFALYTRVTIRKAIVVCFPVKMIKKTLEQEVREYSDDSFSAEGAARHFFASYNEAEIDRYRLESDNGNRIYMR